MNKHFFAASLIVLGTVTMAGVLTVHAQRDRDRGRNSDRWNDRYEFDIDEPDGGQVTSCDQIEATLKRGFLARGEETKTVAQPADLLRLSGPPNGGLRVRGEGRSDYQVRLCKFAAGDSQEEAAQRLAQVHLVTKDGVVTTTGPSDNTWRASVYVEAPESGQMSVDAHNGPLAVEGISGRLIARTMNGPLAIKNCTGTTEVEAVNGPLALTDLGGTVKATSQNGPLAIDLTGSAWEGEGLDARANNGPLALHLPESYQSGVQVTLSNHGPLSCNAKSCSQAMQQWLGGEGRGQLLFGGPTPVVRVAAMNGPVAIR
jgi:hypothetical protein